MKGKTMNFCYGVIFTVAFAVSFFSFGAVTCPLAAEDIGSVTALAVPDSGKAFTLQRQGKNVEHDSAYVAVREGDVIIPAAGAQLLYTPNDVSCDEEQISQQRVIARCAKNDKGIGGMVYDVVTNKYLAAPSVAVGAYASRDGRAFTLRPRLVRLYLDMTAEAQNDAREKLRGTPFLAIAQTRDKADASLRATSTEFVLALGGGVKVTLPSREAAPLRSALLRYAKFMSLTALTYQGLPAKVDCAATVYSPAPAKGPKTFTHEGREWALEKTFPLSGGRMELPVPKESLIEFSLKNNSGKHYYFYLVNFTDTGDIMPLFPSTDGPEQHFLLTAGTSRELDEAMLALKEPVEYVTIIASEHRLNTRQLEQGGFAAEAEKGENAALAFRPVPEKTLNSALAVFRR